MDMPEDDAVAFGHLVRWVYTSVLNCGMGCDKISELREKSIEDEIPETMLEWCPLWILADKLGVPPLVCAANDYSESCSWGMDFKLISAELLGCCFQVTPEHAPIRNILIHVFVQGVYSQGEQDLSAFDSEVMGYKEFANAIVVAVFDHMRIEKDDYAFQNCHLHANHGQVYSPNDKSLLKEWTTAGFLAGQAGEPNPCVTPLENRPATEGNWESATTSSTSAGDR